jgi:hypothetical protein
MSKTDEFFTCVDDLYTEWSADKQGADYDWSQVNWYELDNGFGLKCDE